MYPLTEGSLRVRRLSHHLLFCPCLLSTMFYSEASDPSLMSISFIILWDKTSRTSNLKGGKPGAGITVSEASATDHTLLPVVSGQCQDSVEQCMEEETCSSSRKEWWWGELSRREVSLCSLKRWPQWPDILSLVSTPQRFCSHPTAPQIDS